MSVTPSSAPIHYREDIGLFHESIDLEANRRGYVGFDIAPIIETGRKRGRFTKFSIGQKLQGRVDDTRTPRGGYNRLEQTFGEGVYSCEERGLEFPVDASNAAEWEEMIDLYDVGVEQLQQHIAQNHEVRVMDKINAVVPEYTLLDAERWHLDSALVTVLFNQLKFNFRLRTGVMPNCLVLDIAVVDRLFENASVLEKLGSGAGNTVDHETVIADRSRENRKRRLDLLAIALGIDEVIAADSVKNAGAHGVDLGTGEELPAVLDVTFPLTKAVLMRKQTAKSTREIQWLRTIHWNKVGSRPGGGFEEYPEPQTAREILRMIFNYSLTEINKEAVMVIDNVVDETKLGT